VVLNGDVPQAMIELSIKKSYAFVIPKNNAQNIDQIRFKNNDKIANG
jgi:hypothetical protein